MAASMTGAAAFRGDDARDDLIEPLILGVEELPLCSDPSFPISNWRRYLLLFLVAVAAHLQYCMRANLSVAMTVLPAKYGWDERWTDPVLSAFFWGYMAGGLPASEVVRHLGGRDALAVSVLASSLLNLALPLVAAVPRAVVALRVACGFLQALTFPSIYQLLSGGATASERSRAVGAVKSLGEAGGAAVGFLASDALLRGGAAAMLPGISGVALVFQVFGAAGIAWTTAWLLLVPRFEPGCARVAKATAAVPPLPSAPPLEPAPWRSFFTHPVALALFFNHIAASFVSYGLLTELPLFLQSHLRSSPLLARLALTLPYAATATATLAACAAADAAIAGGANRTSVRRGCQAFGLVACGVPLLGCTLVRSPEMAVALLTTAYGMFGVTSAGFAPCYIEISPGCTARFYAISNVLGTIPGILAPFIVSACKARFGVMAGWHAAFGIFGLGIGVPAAAAFCAVVVAQRVPALDVRLAASAAQSLPQGATSSA